MPNYTIPVQLFEKVFYKVQELKKKIKFRNENNLLLKFKNQNNILLKKKKNFNNIT